MFTDPVKNLKAFGIKEDMLVADLGAGTGFYTIVAAEMAPLGKVYAIEIQKDFLDTIQNKAKEQKLENVHCLWGDVEKKCGTKIKDQIIDRVIASNILFQVENKDRFIEEAKRILKKEGKLLFIDWSIDSTFKGNELKALSKDKAKNLFEIKGFKLDREIDTGAHHYGMIFSVAGE
ncbi:MAG: class I SAM-dependent methyltransferase [Candidatus Pacebacteria bacterium]|nr:class I SAM-dependent methyltransferase [Candidatus Paceibacterota bacterium]MBP9839789.1 class I SAM-dependent methyltransferase [Candidatus Paceibacterota bacterium]MDQ5922425.1 hypothetical protein [Patescibacteria group bacterium]